MGASQTLEPGLRSRLLDYIKKLYAELVPAKAISPDLGGEGELRRALLVERLLESLGLEYRRVDAEDPRAEGGVRPNILATLPGRRRSPRLWIVSHLDTVPEGDPSLWKYPPYEATFVGDRVYGRGVEDDLQAVVESLALAWLLRETGRRPEIDLGFAFVSDEEAGSRYGLLYLLEKHVWGDPSREWFIVPDAGSPDGSRMLVAEKHILWVRVTVRGRQGHASMPDRALNAARHAMRFNLLLDDVLHSRFTGFDALFEPPVSTFEPTRRHENVPNINTIPGSDTTYWDNRILPSYDIDDVVSVFRSLAAHYKAATGVDVDVEIVARDEAGRATPTSHPLVQALGYAIRETRGVEALPKGIGGGTVARYLRRHGYPAVVWMTCDETAHQPNEYTRLSYVAADVETLYYLVTSAASRLAA